MNALCTKIKAGLPEGTTHVSLTTPYWRGSFSISFCAFKFVDGNLMTYTRDNDGEYPQWVPWSNRFYHMPDLFTLE